MEVLLIFMLPPLAATFGGGFYFLQSLSGSQEREIGDLEQGALAITTLLGALAILMLASGTFRFQFYGVFVGWGALSFFVAWNFHASRADGNGDSSP